MKTSRPHPRPHARAAIAVWSRRSRLPMRGLTVLLLLALVGASMLQPILVRADAPAQTITTCYNHDAQGGYNCLISPTSFTDTGLSTYTDSATGDVYACILVDQGSGTCTVGRSVTLSSVGEGYDYVCLVNGVPGTTSQCSLDVNFSGATAPPAPLLDQAALAQSATPAERTALAHLEQQAITNTLSDHGLPSSDAAAAQTWGRDDALAELWGLIEAALKKSPTCSAPGDTCRSADEQQVVEWFEHQLQQQPLDVAYDTGLEYTKWAGLDQSQYARDWLQYKDAALNGSDTSAARAQLEGFLAQTPVNYAVPEPGVTWGPGTSLDTIAQTATEGYCVYQPPAGGPGYTAPTSLCDTPGGGISCLFDCTPIYPDASQFEAWGEAEAQSKVQVDASTANAERAIAASLTLGGIAATAPAGIGTYNLMLPVFTSAFDTVSAVTTTTVTAVRTFDATAAATIEVIDALEIADTVAASSSVVGGAVAGIIFFATTLTAEILKMTDNNAVAGQVAGALEGATQTPTIDLTDPNTLGTLFTLFTDASLPSPKIGCSGAGCLNPPPPPAVDLVNDDDFVVTAKDGTQSRQSSITFYDQPTKVTTSARLHGSWFITQQTDAAGNQLQVTDNDGVSRNQSQALHIVYTDWDHHDEVAMLQAKPGGGYQFVSMPIGQGQQDSSAIDPHSCISDGTCTVSDSIHYLDSSGNQYSATVVPALKPVPTVNPTWSANPTEGQPVTLHANAAVADGFTITSYKWEIQDKPLNAASTTVTETGDPLTYTFPTSGTFKVTLTVTASDAQATTDTFEIQVADVAPTLIVYGPCYQLKSTFCIGTDFNLALVNPGSPTTLRGSVQNAGTEDVDQLTIQWGDGSSDRATNMGTNSDTNVTFPGPPQGAYEPAPTFSATHTYSRGGTYTVTVTVQDQGGATVSQTINEEVVSTTSTGLESSPNLSVVGQQVTYTAKIDPSPDGGTVDFQDGGTDIAACAKQPITSNGTEGVATCVVTYSAAGTHSVTALYSGDTLYAGSGSAVTTQTVGKATTVTKATSSQATTVWGELVTFTATISVAAPGAGTPSGTVEFKDGSTDICAAAAVDTSTETATCTTSALSVSTHKVTAVYSGDDNFQSSNTSGTALTQTVNKADSHTTLSSSQEPAMQGATVTFTAQVGPVAPGAGTPSGTVTFTDGSTTLGSAQLDGTGKASFSTSTLALGAHTITVSYYGEGNFNPSASAALTQQIDTSLSRFPKTSSGAYNLSGANLTGAYLADMPLASAHLNGANLTNVVLIGADLTNANLSNSNFKGANFTGANLTNANLSGSNFTGANFTGANLTKANLSGSNVKGANFTNANLTGANLNGAQISGAIWNKTTCPDGTNSSANGGTCKGHL